MYVIVCIYYRWPGSATVGFNSVRVAAISRGERTIWQFAAEMTMETGFCAPVTTCGTILTATVIPALAIVVTAAHGAAEVTLRECLHPEVPRAVAMAMAMPAIPAATATAATSTATSTATSPYEQGALLGQETRFCERA